MTKKILQNLEPYNTLILLTIIILIGAYFRLVGLIDQSYWLDELYSADFSNPSRSFSSMLLITLNDVHPPLYQSLLWVLYKIFGYNEFVGRGFSAAAGILSIIAIYFLGKELFNKHVGVIASFLLAINYFAIYYSLETRSYAMLMLLSIVSYTYFVRVLNPPSTYNLFLYWVITIVLFYTHYFGFFLVATQVVLFLIYIVVFPSRRKELFKIAAYTYFVFMVSLMPIMPFIIKNRGINSFWIRTPSRYFFINYILSYFHSKPIALLLAISASISIYFLLKKTTDKNARLGLVILLVWIIIDYLLPYLRSVLSTPLLTNRNTIIVLPAIIMFASYAIWRFPKMLKFAFLLVVFLLSVYAIYPYYNMPIKGQYREVVNSVKSNKDIRIYNAIPYGAKIGTNHYQTYIDMLKADIVVHPRQKLEEDLKTMNLTNCFLVLDAQGDHITDLKITSDNTYQKINEVKLHGASIVLFSKSSNADSCLSTVKIN